MTEASLLAYDFRGHGLTQAKNIELSIPQLTLDLENILSTLYPNGYPDIVLVGHSLGGAVAVNATLNQNIKNILGVVVIDVIEELAVESLQGMNRFLDSRPNTFNSIEEAVDWTLEANIIKNKESAIISVPSQLRKEGNGFVWRTDLGASSPYWNTWFKDLSCRFLSCKCAKLLIIAGQERLDKVLMIAQMQGKFQLEIFAESGHMIQEDEPEKTAQVLLSFAKRNGKIVLPPKVPN